jgi:hypothetical protein
MTLLTSQGRVSTGQREVTFVVIKIHMIPTGWIMAGRTVFTKLPIVLVILLMTRIAIHGRSFELLIDMTRFTGDVRMPALQFERGEIMIELCGRPAIRGVAIGAAETKSSFVRFIALVAGVAILRGLLEVADAAGIDMALHASQTHMLTSDFERKGIMIEIFSKTIHAIMTIETG